MLESSKRGPALLGAAGFAAVSWGIAAAYVVGNGGFGAGDLDAFAFWCFLLALPAYPALRTFDRWSAGWRPVFIYLAAAAFGFLAGVASLFAVGAILGGWMGAFSFPVFLCWLCGSVAAFVAVALLRQPVRWPFAVPAVALPIVAALVIIEVTQAKPPDLIIHMRPGMSAELETVWTEVLGTPHPSGQGYMPVEGIGSISRFDGDGESRIRVAFQPGTSVRRRAAIVEKVLASPLVARTTDVGVKGGESRGSDAAR